MRATTTRPSPPLAFNVPDHSGSVFLVHRIGTAEREWQLSGGAAHVGRRSDATDARGLILPSYWKLKAGVEAPLTPTLRAQLEADNLLDTRSAQSSYNSDRIDPAPRAPSARR